MRCLPSDIARVLPGVDFECQSFELMTEWEPTTNLLSLFLLHTQELNVLFVCCCETPQCIEKQNRITYVQLFEILAGGLIS
jgi:hypothetical protein